MIFIVLCYSHPVISLYLVFTRLEVNKNFVFVSDAVYQKLKYFCFVSVVICMATQCWGLHTI